MLFALLTASIGASQKYSGPRPPKPDVPYLMHADNLIETEALQSRQEDRGRDKVAWVPGISSAARTPMAEPIFLMEAQKIVPDKLELYKLDVKRDRREVVFSKKPGKNDARPLRLSMTSLGEKLYRIEANETLDNGEYALSPSGSDEVFCFQVY